MVQLVAFRRSLVALALCSAAIVVSVAPASARSHHGFGRHAHAHYAGRHARRHFAFRHYRHVARRSHWDAGVAQMRARGLAGADASIASSTASSSVTMSGGFGSSNIVA
jgi:uncharacterized protein (TIGR02594 family)